MLPGGRLSLGLVWFLLKRMKKMKKIGRRARMDEGE